MRVLRRKLRREEVHTFFASLSRCLVGMEADATAHYWAREIAALGHDTRLIRPLVCEGLRGPAEQ